MSMFFFLLRTSWGGKFFPSVATCLNLFKILFATHIFLFFFLSWWLGGTFLYLCVFCRIRSPKWCTYYKKFLVVYKYVTFLPKIIPNDSLKITICRLLRATQSSNLSCSPLLKYTSRQINLTCCYRQCKSDTLTIDTMSSCHNKPTLTSDFHWFDCTAMSQPWK